jgi:deoxyribose-phosphate aldolase
MYIDFLFNDTDIIDIDLKNNISQLLSLSCVNSITVPFYFLKNSKSILAQQNHSISLSCLIDYPLGVSDPKSRQNMAMEAISSGAVALDIVMPQNLVTNRKYEKIRDDVKSFVNIAINKNITIRYILEYRFFSNTCLKKICEIFDVFDIQYVFPSTGYFIDNLADNLIAGAFLHDNSKNINIICSGNLWTNKHFEILKKSGIFGFRTNNINCIRNFIEYS